MEGYAKECPFWADCPQGTDDICSQDIRGALGSCFIAHGLVFLLISSLLGWVSWRVVGVVQRKGRKSSDQQHELELKERANPACHNRQSSDDGNLLRRIVTEVGSLQILLILFQWSHSDTVYIGFRLAKRRSL